jgi:hypothetical protein
MLNSHTPATERLQLDSTLTANKQVENFVERTDKIFNPFEITQPLFCSTSPPRSKLKGHSPLRAPIRTTSPTCPHPEDAN